MIAERTASSSGKLVRMITRTSGISARISRQASMPDPSGRRTSMTTRSGRNRRTTESASSAGPGGAGREAAPGREADAVVRDDEADPLRDPVRMDRGARGAGVAGDVAQRLARDAQQLERLGLRQLQFVDPGGLELDVHHRVEAELVGQRRPAAAPPGLLEQLGAGG